MDNSKIKEKLIDIILYAEEGLYGKSTRFPRPSDLREFLMPTGIVFDLSKKTVFSLTDYLHELLKFIEKYKG